MKFRDILTSAFFLKCIFVLSLFILLFISSVSYKHAETVNNATEALVHSHKVRNELEVLISYIKDAETGQRGFIISHDSSFLQPYLGARQKVDRSLYTLKQLAGSDYHQLNNIDTLYHLSSLEFSYLAKSLTQSTTFPINDAQINEVMAKSKTVMNNIRSHINAMSNHELVTLKEKQQRLNEEITFTPLLTLILLIFSMLVFAISYFKINNDLLKFKKANERLLMNFEAIKHAEHIGKFSTWEWNLETNKLSFSDNQYRLLGVEPQSFEADMEHFMEFVHPNDRHIIIEGSERIINERKSSSAFFRIIRKDGEQRYFQSMGKIITHLNGNKTLIGINSDVTSQHKKDLALQERNYKLEQTNKELESFNYVASHDLQEPLRIIQLYISRLADKEKDSLSKNGKEYFERIQLSANRMQVLINDLLLFSRTNKAENEFEQTDLNDLLQNAREDFAQLIEEKKAIVQSSVLPTLMVIPFQIQQLFVNLISNSLKYSRTDEAPVIKISSNLVKAKNYPKLDAEPEKQFYKISFQDNGIGFEQEFAENIFVLFKRLHQKNDYPGTGIGLSICKKIADNHSGFIFAEGRPGSGASFHFFIPSTP